MEHLEKEVNTEDCSEKHRAIIEELYPELDIHGWNRVTEGVNNYVYDADDKYIFRFAREGKESKLEKERKVLDMISSKISVEVPDFTFFGTNPAFVGYEKIKGEILSFGEMNHLPEDQKKAIADDIANFFIEFHKAIPVEEAEKQDLPRSWDPEHSLAKVKKEFEELGNEEIVGFVGKVEDRLRENPLSDQVPVTMYQDFHNTNIILDPETRRLKAVLDFGEVGVGDIHQEFTQMYKRNKDFTEEVIRSYNEKTGSNINSFDVETYTLIRELRKVLIHKDSMENEQYKGGVANLRSWLGSCEK